MTDKKTYKDFIQEACNELAVTLLEKDKQYGGSWLKRGGVGAYMNQARKLDRLEVQVEQHGYDVFKAVAATASLEEGVGDTLLDTAGYAILILAEMKARAANG